MNRMTLGELKSLVDQLAEAHGEDLGVFLQLVDDRFPRDSRTYGGAAFGVHVANEPELTRPHINLVGRFLYESRQ